jgi:AraC-like DNA-binding protein
MDVAVVPEIPGLEVVRMDAVARTWSWYHETYTIAIAPTPVWVEWRYRGRIHRAMPDCIGLMEPGELHTELRKLHPRDVLRVAMLSPAMVHEAACEVGMPAADLHWRDAQVNRPDLRCDLWGLHAALEREATALERQVRAAELFERLVTQFMEHVSPSRPVGEDTAVWHARDLLHDRFADSVSLDDLAAASGLGRFQLSRRFRVAFGLPPHAYQMHVRVSRASALIRQGFPLVQVALETGFVDQSHLTRHFTRAVGISPGRYRQAIR